MTYSFISKKFKQHDFCPVSLRTRLLLSILFPIRSQILLASLITSITSLNVMSFKLGFELALGIIKNQFKSFEKTFHTTHHKITFVPIRKNSLTNGSTPNTKSTPALSQKNAQQLNFL